jgi:hypothetical protein
MPGLFPDQSLTPSAGALLSVRQPTSHKSGRGNRSSPATTSCIRLDPRLAPAGLERTRYFRAFPLQLACIVHGLLRFFPGPVHGLFLPLLFLGTASGEFLRPAGSRLLLSRFLPRNLGSLPECSRSPWEQWPSLWGAPGKWGKKRRKTCTPIP